MGVFFFFGADHGVFQTTAFKMSADLAWAICRDNHSYLLKKRTIKKPFSTEANNLRNVNSQRYNGFCGKKVIGIEPAEGGKGIVLAYKTAKYQNKSWSPRSPQLCTEVCESKQIQERLENGCSSSCRCHPPISTCPTVQKGKEEYQKAKKLISIND